MAQTTSEAGSTALYRLYDAHGALLYVGITSDPERRWKQHAIERADTWWPQVARRSVEWVGTRTAAEEAEVKAITEERPLHNRAHNLRASAVEEEMAEKREIFPRQFSDYGPLAGLITQEIDAGAWRPGERLPTHRELMRRFMVSQATLQRAMLVLQHRGVVRNVKVGYVVASPEDRTVAVPVGRPVAAAAALQDAMAPEALHELVKLLTAEWPRNRGE